MKVYSALRSCLNYVMKMSDLLGPLGRWHSLPSAVAFSHPHNLVTPLQRLRDGTR